jgi:pimeloyl-ACP methyl ester carboxylesterase
MKQKSFRKRRLITALVLGFVFLNAFAAIHAYKFTHFTSSEGPRTKDESQLGAGEKLRALAFGVSVPKPENDKVPVAPFSTVRIDAGKRLEAWYLPAERASGTVILFHGYAGCRAGMLAKAERFRALGYNCLVPDFSGAGGSAGNDCSIGYHEADEVRQWHDYLQQKGIGPVVLTGQSMGAVAIMKAMQDTPMPVTALILECPYGSMQQTVEARFRTMGVPAFPMAQLLVFWGGAMQGFNAFSLKPETYARSLKVPVLLIHGTDDRNVSREETESIFANLAGPKQRLELDGAGHNDFLEKRGPEWQAAVSGFLKRYDSAK